MGGLCTQHGQLVGGGHQRREHEENLLANRLARHDFGDQPDNKPELRHAAVHLLGVRCPSLGAAELGVTRGPSGVHCALVAEIVGEDALITLERGARHGVPADGGRGGRRHEAGHWGGRGECRNGGHVGAVRSGAVWCGAMREKCFCLCSCR